MDNDRKLSALVMDHMDSICYLSDTATYELLYLTKAGMNAYGMKGPEDYRGKKCYQVLQGLDQPCPFCTNDRLVLGETYRWEYHNEKIGRWYDLTDSLLEHEGRLCRMEVARDITDRKETDAIPQRLTMEDALYRCLHTLSNETDFATAVDAFLEIVGEYYHADRAYIIEFDFTRQTTINTFEWCAEGVTPQIQNLQDVPMAMAEPFLPKFESCGGFSIDSLHDEYSPGDPLYHHLNDQEIVSLMAAPLRSGGQIVGFLGVDNPRRNPGNLALLRSVSEFVLAELEKRRLLEELERLSYVDTLTGLGNRNRYARSLRTYETAPPNRLGAIALDINGLKEINDTHGHEYGDQVLKRAAEILKAHFARGLYRIGGDEFLVLCSSLSKEDFQDRVVSLRAAFDQEKTCHVSMGFAWNFDADAVDINALLQQADEMRHAEKQSYYHSVLSEGRSIYRTGFAGEVLREIEEDRFLVYYQPQVDLRTGAVVGAEALVRKRAEDGSIIPPGKFLPFYEVGGVISHIDLFVLRTACATLRQWQEQGHDLHVSVNFSRVTLLEPYVVDVISGICAEHQVSPASITIEVTESIGKMDHEYLKDLITKLKEAGFSISLDDFGSQYSNLAILATMDFDEVKFDRSLVSTLEENPKSRVVMKNGMDLCRELQGTSSLAEGIETKGQLDLLADFRCDYGQGYYFSRPVPLDQFDVFLAEHTGRSKE